MPTAPPLNDATTLFNVPNGCELTYAHDLGPALIHDFTAATPREQIAAYCRKMSDWDFEEFNPEDGETDPWLANSLWHRRETTAAAVTNWLWNHLHGLESDWQRHDVAEQFVAHYARDEFADEPVQPTTAYDLIDEADRMRARIAYASEALGLLSENADDYCATFCEHDDECWCEDECTCPAPDCVIFEDGFHLWVAAALVAYDQTPTAARPGDIVLMLSSNGDVISVLVTHTRRNIKNGLPGYVGCDLNDQGRPTNRDRVAYDSQILGTEGHCPELLTAVRLPSAKPYAISEVIVWPRADPKPVVQHPWAGPACADDDF